MKIFEDIFIELKENDDTVTFIFENDVRNTIEETILEKTVKLWKSRPITNTMTPKNFANKVMILIVNSINVNLNKL